MACSGPLTAGLEPWCRPSGMGLRPPPVQPVAERVAGALRDCGPMLRVTLDGYMGAP